MKTWEINIWLICVTNITDDATKKTIVRNFCSRDSELRVVIATVAFGMGINCPDASQVIHFRSPSSLLNYAQEAGRCGRNGNKAEAKLYFSSKEFGICSSKFNRKKSKYQTEICDLEKMKSYVTNTSKCRRYMLLDYLDGESDAKKEMQKFQIVRHSCCDICASRCDCEDCLLNEAMNSMEIQESTGSPSPESTIKCFTSEQKVILESKLLHLRASLSEDACLLSADHSFGFTVNVVQQIVENCDTLTTEEDILEKADIWNANLAQEVLAILKDVAKLKK